MDPLGDHPGEAGGRRGDGGGGEGQAGQAAGGIGAVDADDRAAGVEAEPAEPEQADAEQGQRQAVRSHPLGREAVALAEEDEHRQGGNTGGEVNDGAAGEIEGALFEEPAVDHPHPVGKRIIDQGGPEQDEQAVGGELDPLGQGAGDQGHGDHGEHALDTWRRRTRGCRPGSAHVLEEGVDRGAVLEGDQAVEHRLAEVADQAAAGIGAEGEGVADHRPLHADDPHGDKGMHHGGEDVLGADHAAVEEGQAGDHEQDQRRGDQHPGGVAGIERRRALGQTDPRHHHQRGKQKQHVAKFPFHA